MPKASLSLDFLDVNVFVSAVNDLINARERLGVQAGALIEKRRLFS